MSRKLLSLGIVAFWLAMNSWLLQREVFLPRLDAARVRVPGGLQQGSGPLIRDEAFGIYFDKAKVGYVTSELSRTGDSHLLRNTAELKLALLNQELDVRFQGTAWLGADGIPDRLNFVLGAGPNLFRVRGQRRGDTLDVQLVSAGRVVNKSIPVVEGLSLSNGITPSFFLPDMELGQAYTMEILDPRTMSASEARIRIRGKEPYQYRGAEIEATVVDLDLNGLKFVTHVSEGGVVLRQESEMGWYLVREDFEVATQGFATASVLQEALQDMVSLRADRSFADPQNLTFMDVRLSGFNAKNYALEGAGQVITDPGTHPVVRIQRTAPQGEIRQLPITDTAYAEFLRPEPLIQSDDNEIQERAKRIVGNETDSWLAARKIGQWVYTAIEKELIAGVPSAVEVLEVRKGDCNEHTVLFTALARAAGVPTRMAVGIVYNSGRYYYHAWPEVFVGEWVAMDPTFGQDVADATHIRLLEGNILEFARIAELLGKLEITVVADSEMGPIPDQAA